MTRREIRTQPFNCEADILIVIVLVCFNVFFNIFVLQFSRKFALFAIFGAGSILLMYMYTQEDVQ